RRVDYPLDVLGSAQRALELHRDRLKLRGPLANEGIGLAEFNLCPDRARDTIDSNTPSICFTGDEAVCQSGDVLDDDFSIAIVGEQHAGALSVDLTLNDHSHSAERRAARRAIEDSTVRPIGCPTREQRVFQCGFAVDMKNRIELSGER